MIEHDAAVESLLSWYQGATIEQQHSGRTWYDDQRTIVREIALAEGVSPVTVAAVVAALSPQCPWQRNIAGAIRLIRAFRNGEDAAPRDCTIYYRNAVKAWRILQGADAAEVFVTSPKVLPFWRNLCGDENAVTIDTWMLRACGVVEWRKGARPALVNALTEAVEEAALKCAETPADFQAIVWVTIRGSAE